MDLSNTKMSCPDLKPTINKFIHEKWQKSWDDQYSTNFPYIQNIVSEWPAGYRRNGKEEVILSKLHIGHIHITHSHHLKREGILIFSMCKVPFTVEHILLN